MSGRLSLIVAALPAFAYFFNVGSIGFWLPLYAKELGWSYTEITLLATGYFIAVTIATPLAGAASDLTRRPGLVLALGMAVVSLTSIAMTLPRDPPSLIALRSLQGFGLAVGIPVALGSLSLMAGVRRGVSITAASSGLGMAVGAGVSGMLAEVLGFKPIFYLAAVVAGLASISALAWNPPVPPRERGFLEALRSVPPEVLVVMAALFVRNFFASGVFSVLAIIFNVIVGVGYLATGVALAVNPSVQTMVSLAAPAIVRGAAAASYSLGIAGTGLVFTLYLSATSLQDLIAAQVLQGFFYAVTVVSGNTLIVSLSPRDVRYTASSLYNLAFNAGWIAGTVAAGPIMDSLGVEAWVEAASLGVALSSLIPLVLLRSQRARAV